MTFTATYDGRTLTPSEPLALSLGTPVTLTVADADAPPRHPLLDLLAELDRLPDNPDAPTDGSTNYKHYLYGLPKQS